LPLALMFFLMALRQALTLLVRAGFLERTTLTTTLSEIPGFIVTLLALISIIYIWNLFSFRKRMENAENKLLLSDEKFRIMAEFSYDWEAWHLSDGSYGYISPSCEQITGYTQAEFIAEPDLVLKITHPDDRETVTEHYSRHLLPKTESDELKFRIVTKNGNLRWIWHKCGPVILKSGEWQGRSISSRDITESKDVEERLEEKETQFNNAQQIAKLGHWKHTPEVNRLEWSNEIFSIFDLNPLQIGASIELFFEMVHPDDREFVSKAYTESLENRIGYDIEYRVALKNGTEKWVRQICSTKYDENGKPLYSLGIIQDITKKKDMEKQFLEARDLQADCKRLESLKTMAGAIAHRFNNSMTAVLGNLQLAEMTLAAELDEHKMITEALAAAQGASRVGSLMLTYLGQQFSKLERASLSELVRNVVTEMKNDFLPSITLNYSTPSESFECDMDRQQIKEVMRSIINNAIDSLDSEAGTIEIIFGSQFYHVISFPLSFQDDDGSLSDGVVDGNYLFCQIRDSGSGISKENLQRVFEPFFTTKFVGRGLGLALTVGIMKSHHGALTVESIIGQGTTVRILLPATIG